MASLLYSDGRVGLAAAALSAVIDTLGAVVAAVTISDAERAAALSGDLAAVKAATVTTLDVDGVAALTGRTIELVRDIGRASEDADVATEAWLRAAVSCAGLQVASASAVTTRAAAMGNAIAGLVEAACFGEYAVALSQGSFVDRQSGLAAKAALSSAAEPVLERVASVCGEEAWSVIAQAVSYAADHLSARALDLRPIVVVNAPLSLPATAAAWALYGDPARADELVVRNRVSTPALMPRSFEALAP